jgi:predicted nucleic-acid-binding protein
MTNSNGSGDINIEALLIQLTRSHLTTQEEIQTTQQQLRNLTNQTESVFARNEILNEILLELRDSHETMRENFEGHQRTTNAALHSLEAILLKLTERSN